MSTGPLLTGTSGYRGAWRHTARADVDGTIKLVGKILRGTPSLPGAACIGRNELFDDIARENPE